MTGVAPRPARPREALILDALERLLAESPLRDLGVEEIAQAAGITRTRFYHYFGSKQDAYSALLERISAEVLEVYNRPGSWWVRPAGAAPRASLRDTLARVLAVWFKHGHVLREASDMWNAAPEARDHWRRSIEGLVDRTCAAIERERALGVAPPGPDARQLAASLSWQGERLLFLSLIGAPGAMTVEEHVELGVFLWMRSIYLVDDPGP